MPSEPKAATESRTPAGLIAAAWIVVSLPLAWGIYNTALGAARLFTHINQPVPTQVKAP
jgi:hypothetical protein